MEMKVTNEQLTKVRDALAKSVEHLDSPPAYVIAAVDILDAAIAAPEQDPIARVTGYHGGHCVIEPLDGKSVFPTGMAVYSAPVAAQEVQPMQWIDVSERVPDEAQIVLFVLKGKVVVGAWIAGIFWYDNAKQVATAWMPLPPPPEFGVGGYPVTAPPSREWQELSPLEMRDTLRNCAASTFDKLAPNWYEVRQFARAIESALRAKNTGEQA